MLKKTTKQSNSDEVNAENKFTYLEYLVAAPLHALASSNALLSSYIKNVIDASGTQTVINDDSITMLNNVNLGYKQVKQGLGNSQIKEDMMLQVPLLSIMPLSNLQIKKAKIDFNAEVRGTQDSENKYHYQARVCAPESRMTDFLPKIHFEIEVESTDLTEGMARSLDVLNTNQIPKKLNVQAVNPSGAVLVGCEQEAYDQHQKIITTLNQIASAKEKILQAKESLIVTFDAELKEISELSDNTYETFVANNQIDRLNNLLQRDPTNIKLQTLKQNYDNIQTNENHLQELTKKENECN